MSRRSKNFAKIRLSPNPLQELINSQRKSQIEYISQSDEKKATKSDKLWMKKIQLLQDQILSDLKRIDSINIQFALQKLLLHIKDQKKSQQYSNESFYTGIAKSYRSLFRSTPFPDKQAKTPFFS
jgi:hypothetical protein